MKRSRISKLVKVTVRLVRMIIDISRDSHSHKAPTIVLVICVTTEEAS